MPDVPTVPAHTAAVLARLRWMRERRIWPNGLRYLWTDAFGVVLLVSLHRILGEERYLDEAAWVVAEVDRVLGRRVGIWVDPPGYFCREPGLSHVMFAFTNYGVSLGLQAVGEWSDRVERLHVFFAGYRSGDAYDSDAITHVMGCASHLPAGFLGGRPGPATRGQR